MAAETTYSQSFEWIYHEINYKMSLKMNARRTRSLSFEVHRENTKIKLTATRSICCTAAVNTDDGRGTLVEQIKKQPVIKFEENTYQTDTRPSHDTLAAQPSIRSWFSLVANMSNRPSIFSKFRGASHFDSLVFFCLNYVF